MKTIFIILTLLMCSVFVNAQVNVDTGLWNDLQITKTVNKTVDVVVGARFDTKRDTRSFAEQRTYFGANIKDGGFTFQPMVLLLKNFSKTPYYETRLQATLGYKFTTHNKVNITPKVRVEYHAKRHLKNDGRIVPVFSIDKKISKNYGVFNTDEFWLPIGNSKDVAKYRKRLFWGITRTFNPHLSVDLFYLYQRDEQVFPKNTHKLGLTWKIKL